MTWDWLVQRTGEYCPFVAWNTRNFKPEYLVGWKAPNIFLHYKIRIARSRLHALEVTWFLNYITRGWGHNVPNRVFEKKKTATATATGALLRKGLMNRKNG